MYTFWCLVDWNHSPPNLQFWQFFHFRRHLCSLDGYMVVLPLFEIWRSFRSVWVFQFFQCLICYLNYHLKRDGGNVVILIWQLYHQMFLQILGSLRFVCTWVLRRQWWFVCAYLGFCVFSFWWIKGDCFWIKFWRVRETYIRLLLSVLSWNKRI